MTASSCCAPGMRVVDLGAAPGGWTQVALRQLGERGEVVALDLLPMDNLAGAKILQGDFQEDATEAAVLEALGGSADLVLSDMAPNTTGHGPTDHLRIMDLARSRWISRVKVLARRRLRRQGVPGRQREGNAGAAAAEFRRGPPRETSASRKESSELYVGWRPGSSADARAPHNKSR